MSMPRVLIIDDQYAVKDDERALLLNRTNMLEVDTDTADEQLVNNKGAIAAAVFCSGQKIIDGKRINDLETVCEKVCEGWGMDKKWNWAVVFIDVHFISTERSADDEHFGVRIAEYLHGRKEFETLPIVLLTDKPQKEISNWEIEYLSKTNLNTSTIRNTLLNKGLLSSKQIKRIIGLPNEIVANSEEMLKVFKSVYDYAASEYPVMILGETGVGKEVVSKLLHNLSIRMKGPYITQNCSAIAQDLFESQFYGSVQGAYTSSKRNTDGYFKLADKGTLFLDEIGDMPISQQPKLLRAIEDMVIRPLGSEKTIKVDVRIVSATNKTLEYLSRDDVFRQDLFARLSILKIWIPPLRDRKEDIVPLAELFLEEHCTKECKEGVFISDEAKRVLLEYEYPLNIRELSSVIRTLAQNIGNNAVITKKNVENAISTTKENHTLAEKETSITISADDKEASKIDSHSPRNDCQTNKQSFYSLMNDIENFHFEIDSPDIKGALCEIEHAVDIFLKKLCGVALEKTKHAVTGKINRQEAIQLICNNPNLKHSEPGRIIKKILGRHKSYQITDNDINYLISLWKDE